MTHSRSWVTPALIPGREQKGTESEYLWRGMYSLENPPERASCLFIYPPLHSLMVTFLKEEMITQVLEKQFIVGIIA